MSTFSCFVVGKGAIALNCLELLQQAGHTILGVYSADGSLRTWTIEQSILYIASQSDFCDKLRSYGYNYLFSINNGWIIPADLIVRARQATINYHDALLPKYAGLHATSWALLYGETQHGITWHEVAPEIDTGRILKQAIVPIEPTDTALSLNTRCYETAIAAFRELVTELADDRIEPVAQDLTQRSYFGQDHRPDAAGLIRFDTDAQTIANLVRALDFGPVSNPLGLAKLELSGGIVAVGQARLSSDNRGLPGQVMAIDNGIHVATSTTVIHLSSITTLDGQPLSQAELIEQYGVQIGDRLLMQSDVDRQAISDRNAAICSFERRWIKRLAQLSPFVHPYLNTREFGAAVCRFEISVNIGARSLLALFALYCARLASESKFDLTLQTEAQRSVAPEIFAQAVPIQVELIAEDQIQQFCDRFEAALIQSEQWGSYALDSVARYPELRGRSINLAVAIAIVPSPPDLNFESLNAAMALVAYSDGSAPELVHQGALSTEQSYAIVEHLQCLIAASRDQPDQPAIALPLLSLQEQQKILIEWNQTAQPYPHDRTIHELITQQAAKTPTAIAVQFGDATLSYEDLDRRSNQVARWLRSLGVQSETLVALCVPRSVDLIVGLLGILKAGGAYVPIDPTYPNDRIAYLLQDSDAAAIVTVKSLQSLFSHAETILLDDDQLGQFDTDAINSGATPETLAYVIYTSGSTGKPKGVEVQHRSVINHSWAIANLYRLSDRDRVLQSASISFDVAGEQIYPALFRGAAIVVRPDDLFESFERFSHYITAKAISVLILPTAIWQEWTIELVASSQTVPACVRVVSVGTEKVLNQHLTQWQTVSHHTAFFQGYGPTEATITCTLYRHIDQPLEAVPIGRPLPNTEIYILDRHLQPVPIGVVGDLYIGGAGLARGYHNQPQLTHAHFIPHPFHAKSRLYRTGDRARFQPDGQLVYCDRVDDQIKLNGFRIELGEIEAALTQFPTVQQAVVCCTQTAIGHRLVAYVVPAQSVNLEALKEFVRQTLPSHMIPSAIVTLEAFPLTPNGKIDRRALPQPGLIEPASSNSAPRTELEQQLTELWRSLLNLDDLTVNDSFFELGGHSLLAIRLLRQVEQQYQIGVPLGCFLQAPTIAQLALYLQARSDAATPSSEYLVPIQPQGTKRPLFGVHVLGKGLSYYRPLSKHLGFDQPLYGLAQFNDEAAPASLPNVEALASRYIQNLRTLQPQGPYFLVGISFGGTVAFEMAQQLRSQNQTVALLGMLDTAAPIEAIGQPVSNRLGAYWNRLWQLKPSDTIAKIKRHLIDYSLKFAQIEAIYRWIYRVFDRPFPDALQETLYIQQSQNAASQYKPQVYKGEITLFRARDQAISINVVRDPRLGWTELTAAGLQIHDVSGDHLGMMQEPHVQVLAEHLKQYLNDRDRWD